ncbi:G patch domain-containing protein 11 [Daphnia magna]|uniref:G patch domain-containing protein 11 n=2 Tax=Daphnia magna TaxID=35525 RepID=A0A0P5WYJ0_9CRUS|nr:hypothetical protein OUZ56_022973 [Daphnia magna]KZS20587.1 G patch domain-containing protein 11 [Daphnia magna]
MTDSAEEDDYMSEEFLTACVKDVRPGLVFKQSTKRQFQIEEQHRSANEKMRKLNKPVRVLEAEKREEGLSTAISSQNKGFAMLQKMGYNPGKGLGKTEEGRVEPVAVEIKTTRAGLGREAAVKDILQRKMTMLQNRISSQNSSTSVTEFRNRKKDEAVQKLILVDLRKSQRMCQVLDEEKNILEPAELWFWPQVVKDPEESDQEDKDVEEKEEEQLLPGEQLELITAYLRQVHWYCTWCATKFNDDQDLTSSCPGATRDEH